jgi:hypothetical protein
LRIVYLAREVISSERLIVKFGVALGDAVRAYCQQSDNTGSRRSKEAPLYGEAPLLITADDINEENGDYEASEQHRWLLEWDDDTDPGQVHLGSHDDGISAAKSYQHVSAQRGAKQGRRSRLPQPPIVAAEDAWKRISEAATRSIRVA